MVGRLQKVCPFDIHSTLMDSAIHIPQFRGAEGFETPFWCASPLPSRRKCASSQLQEMRMRTQGSTITGRGATQYWDSILGFK